MADWLNGKVVVVTGAETGIGRAIALRALADGASVLAAGINEAGLGETAGLAGEHGERFAQMRVDVTERAQVQAMIAHAVERFGRLDAAVANAGIFVQKTPFLDYSIEEWNNNIAVNLDGVFHTLQAAAKVLIEQGDGGSLLTTTSSNALRPNVGQIPYVAAKGAAHMMVRALAVELAPHKIRVNSIVPGLTLTPGTENRPGHIERGLKLVPMGEVVMPEEIAALVSFAMSDEAPHMTGSELKIDAGRTSA